MLVVALGFVGLALQRVHRLLNFANDVTHPRQIMLYGSQVSGTLPFCDACTWSRPRLPRTAAPLLRAVAQDRLNHFELNDGIGVRSHPRIHEEIADVLQPAQGLVQEVFAFAGAVDAPCDNNFGVFRRENPAWCFRL